MDAAGWESMAGMQQDGIQWQQQGADMQFGGGGSPQGGLSQQSQETFSQDANQWQQQQHGDLQAQGGGWTELQHGGDAQFGAQQGGQPQQGAGGWPQQPQGGNFQQQPCGAGQHQKGGDQGFHSAAGHSYPPNDNVFIGGLPADFSTENVQEVFGAYGEIVQIKHMPPKMAGLNSAALVRFGTLEIAQWVVDNLHNNIPQGLDKPVLATYSHQGKGKAASKGKDFGKGCGKDFGKGYGKDFGGMGKGNMGQGMGMGMGMEMNAGWGAATGSKGHGGKGSAKGAATLLRDAMNANLVGPNSKTVPQECQIYCKHLPADMTDLDMHNLVGPFGPLASGGAKAVTNPDGSCRGIGFANFLSQESAQAAVETLNGFSLPDGHTIFVSINNSGQNNKMRQPM